MSNFDDAFNLLISDRIEGGYANDPNDPGGETKYGISKRSYPNLDIKNLTLDQAKSIYKRDYWDLWMCDALPWRLAIFFFDCAVNQGPDTAIRLLQKHLGLVVDGRIGSITLAAMRVSDPKLDNEFMALRALKYVQTANYIDFGKGWFKRLFYLSINV